MNEPSEPCHATKTSEFQLKPTSETAVLITVLCFNHSRLTSPEFGEPLKRALRDMVVFDRLLGHEKNNAPFEYDVQFAHQFFWAGNHIK